MNKKRVLLKITTLALLSAIGVVLMSFVRIEYPIAPFLKIEISDFVVMFVFLLFGFKDALIVAVVKTLADMLFRGPEGPYGVGHITALIASLSYVLALWVVNKFIKKNNFGVKILKYSLVVLMVSLVMTIANYFFLTPLFLGKHTFLDMSNDALASITGINSYLLSIIVLYMPFNVIKGALISLIGVITGDSLLILYRKKLKIEEGVENEKID